jgi:hypothetical protein
MASRGAIYARYPLPIPIPELSACPQASAPRRDSSIPSARSAQPDSIPSDPANSPFSDWHAQSEHSTQCSRDAVLLLPVAAFIRPRISAPEPICLFYLLEARVSKQTFARPHRLLPFESHRSEVNAPALSLRRNCELFFQPVRP